MTVTTGISLAVNVRLADLGWTRWQLAAALGMSESSLSHRLNGRTRWSLDGGLEALAAALGMKTSELLALAEELAAQQPAPAASDEPAPALTKDVA